jgi:hypothetical protein
MFRGFMITVLDTPHSVGLLWTRDQPRPNYRCLTQHQRGGDGTVSDGTICTVIMSCINLMPHCVACECIQRDTCNLLFRIGVVLFFFK